MEEYILKDKEYFIGSTLETIELFKTKHHIVEKTKMVAKHPNGEVNIAYYDPKTNIITQYNCVTSEKPQGSSVLKYKLYE